MYVCNCVSSDYLQLAKSVYIKEKMLDLVTHKTHETTPLTGIHIRNLIDSTIHIHYCSPEGRDKGGLSPIAYASGSR